MLPDLKKEVVQLHAEICAGLADPTRILILYQLSLGPHNVGEICRELGMPQSLISRHLKILRERGMVSSERHGTVVIYSLEDARLVQALDLLREAMHQILSRRAALIDILPESSKE